MALHIKVGEVHYHLRTHAFSRLFSIQFSYKAREVHYHLQTYTFRRPQSVRHAIKRGEKTCACSSSSPTRDRRAPSPTNIFGTFFIAGVRSCFRWTRWSPPFQLTYVSPTRSLRALYLPQLRRGMYRTLRTLVGETPVRQGAGPSWPAGGVTGPFGPRFRVFQQGSVWQCGWFSWSHTVKNTLCKVEEND